MTIQLSNALETMHHSMVAKWLVAVANLSNDMIMDSWIEYRRIIFQTVDSNSLFPFRATETRQKTEKRTIDI